MIVSIKINLVEYIKILQLNFKIWRIKIIIHKIKILLSIFSIQICTSIFTFPCELVSGNMLEETWNIANVWDDFSSIYMKYIDLYYKFFIIKIEYWIHFSILSIFIDEKYI